MSTKTRMYFIYASSFIVEAAIWFFLCWFSGLTSTSETIAGIVSPIMHLTVLGLMFGTTFYLARTVSFITNEENNNDVVFAKCRKLPLYFHLGKITYAIIGPLSVFIGNDFYSMKEMILGWLFAFPIIMTYSTPFLTYSIKCIERLMAKRLTDADESIIPIRTRIIFFTTGISFGSVWLFIQFIYLYLHSATVVDPVQLMTKLLVVSVVCLVAILSSAIPYTLLAEQIAARIDNKIKALQRETILRKKNEVEKRRLYDQIENHNSDLKKLLYMTAHDLRTPLVNIEGFSVEMSHDVNQMVANILKDPSLKQEVRGETELLANQIIPEHVKTIKLGIQNMNNYLSGILKLSRIGTYEIEKNEIDTEALISDIIESHKKPIQKINAEINIKKLPKCSADETLLKTIFTNIIGNSLKYSSSERNCIIDISAVDEEYKTVYIIKDNGIGLTKEDREKVFNLFFRTKNAKNIEGSGLGLSIAKWAVHRLSGGIILESIPGEGTSFFITIPKDLDQSS